MLNIKDIKIKFSCQGFEVIQYDENEEKNQSVLLMRSTVKTSDVRCPLCGGKVHIHDSFSMHLKDMPIFSEMPLSLVCMGNRYHCCECDHAFTPDIPFRYPGTRVTARAALWIKSFLDNKLSIRSIQNLTGIHWETIRKIQNDIMSGEIKKHERMLADMGYKPRYLAVDEFAIHKGHNYATCVMDLETGYILWVGEGRNIESFRKFFKETDPSLLSEVIAVAMDMNASYNRLVEEYLPDADIVYDRYHMQSQFGKDVLGVVRLEEARKHNEMSKSITARIEKSMDKEDVRKLRKQAKAEKKEYSILKNLRWPLLMNNSNLSETMNEALSNILLNHYDLAVCYAMKEEMCRLFTLKDKQSAQEKWTEWFDAALSSDIPALEKFARLKLKRLPGLVAHAEHNISTGRLEGFNNKIKVAKRIGYGYRDNQYFFTLIRYLSLPSLKCPSPNFP